MKRTAATQKLKRIINVLDSGQIPNAHELYVFGSYSRGALQPNDIDLVLCCDPDPDPTHTYKYLSTKYPPWKAFKILSSIENQPRRLLVRPGERVDMIIEFYNPKGKYLRLLSTIARSMRLLWSRDMPGWQARLAAIHPNPAARRYKRDHFCSLKRLNASLEEMEDIMAALTSKRLILTRIPIDEIKAQPIDHHYIGQKTSKLLPYVIWWFKHHHQKTTIRNGCTISSKTHHALLGKPRLSQMRYLIEEGARRVCLMPHLRRSEPNELLVFESPR